MREKLLVFIISKIFRCPIYTETEVRKLFSTLQYEIAQEILGNRSEKIVPLDFFKEHKK